MRLQSSCLKRVSNSFTYGRSIRNAKGLSLIELIIVIFLIGIIAAIAFPRFGGFMAERSFRSGTNGLIGFIGHIKNKTAITKKGLTLHIDIDTNQYWVTDLLKQEEGIDEDDNPVVFAKKTLNKYTAIKDIVLADNEITYKGEVLISFYPAGYSDIAIIHLENTYKSGKFYSIIIKPMAVRVGVEEGYEQ